MDDNPYNATLVDREDLNEELAIFRVKPNNGQCISFEPGQFATLGLLPDPDEVEDKPSRRRKGPRLIRRAYSIASPSHQRDCLDFYIVRVNEGKLTPKLWRLSVGDELFMGEKITGHFTLEGVPDGKDLVMVGTGTGLAPYHAMIQTFRDQKRWRRLVVFDGCRYIRDLGYLEVMRKIAEEDSTIQYIPTVTREPEDVPWDGQRGRVTELLKPEIFENLVGFELSPQHCHVFLCGNPQMIDQLEASLGELGFVVKGREHPDGNLHFERYW